MKIIKFSAVWCPGCLVMRSVWRKIKDEFSDLDITEYDYDMDEIMVERYNVGDKLPVVIMLDEKGNEIKRMIGEKNFTELKEFIKGC